MNPSWYLFYGYQIGLSRAEIMATRYGEFLDLVACLAIYNGAAKQKRKRMSFDDILNLE